MTTEVRGARRRDGWQRLAPRLALSAAITIVVLCALEAAVRMWFPQWVPRSARMTAFWQFDPRYGWSHAPGTSGRFASLGFDIEVAINAQGFRGPETTHARASGSRRVVLLGDSHAWGFGVEEEQSFARLLEQLIPNLQVVNLGVSGYSTDQELLLYQEEGHRYETDVVMLVVAHNDLRGNTRTIESSVYGKPRFLLEGDDLVLENHPVPAPNRWKQLAFELSARSYLLTRAMRVVDQLRRDADVATGPSPSSAEARARLHSQPFPWSPAHRIMARLILELERQVKAHGRPAPALLVVLADLRNGLGTEIAEYLRARGIPAVALDPHIPPIGSAWHLPDGLHWTAAGHRRVAEILAEPVRELLSRRADPVAAATAGGLGQ
jgi:lysophospholipase L1-like esterase